MKIEDIRSAIDMIRDARKADLVIISLFLLPLLLGAWSIFLNSLSYLDQCDGWKIIIVCILSVVYIVGLWWMKYSDSKEEKLKRARYHIENRLRKRKGNRASFDAIRNEVNKTYTDDFLENLINENPQLFGTVILKKDKKPGITLIEEELATPA